MYVGTQLRLVSGHGIYSNRKMQANRNTATHSEAATSDQMQMQMVVVSQTRVATDDDHAATPEPSNGKPFFKYSGKVVNKSNRPLKSAELVAHYLYGPLQGLHKVHDNGNAYVLPAGTNLQPGQSIDFGYEHAYGEAQIFVLSYELE